MGDGWHWATRRELVGRLLLVAGHWVRPELARIMAAYAAPDELIYSVIAKSAWTSWSNDEPHEISPPCFLLRCAHPDSLYVEAPPPILWSVVLPFAGSIRSHHLRVCNNARSVFAAHSQGELFRVDTQTQLVTQLANLPKAWALSDPSMIANSAYLWIVLRAKIYALNLHLSSQNPSIVFRAAGALPYKLLSFTLVAFPESAIVENMSSTLGALLDGSAEKPEATSAPLPVGLLVGGRATPKPVGDQCFVMLWCARTEKVCWASLPPFSLSGWQFSAFVLGRNLVVVGGQLSTGPPEIETLNLQPLIEGKKMDAGPWKRAQMSPLPNWIPQSSFFTWHLAAHDSRRALIMSGSKEIVSLEFDSHDIPVLAPHLRSTLFSCQHPFFPMPIS
jgi:hypothetical protein